MNDVKVILYNIMGTYTSHRVVLNWISKDKIIFNRQLRFPFHGNIEIKQKTKTKTYEQNKYSLHDNKELFSLSIMHFIIR